MTKKRTNPEESKLPKVIQDLDSLEERLQETAGLLQITSQEMAQAAHELTVSITKFIDYCEHSITREKEREDDLKKSLHENTQKFAEQASDLMRSFLESRTKEIGEEIDGILQDIQGVYRYRRRSLLFVALAFTAGCLSVSALSAWIYGAHLHKKYDFLLVRQAALGQSLAGIWDRLSQAEKNKIISFMVK